MKKYIIQDKEAGNVIDEFETKNEADEALCKYITADVVDGFYVPGFYEIRERDKNGEIKPITN